MQYKVTNKEVDGVGHLFDITIPASDITQAIDARLLEIAPKAQVTGFRPGKAPLAVLRLKYGKDLRGEVLGGLVNEVGRDIVKSNKLKPIGQPEVFGVREEKDGGFSLSYAVLSLPNFKMETLSEISIDRFVASPSEAELTEALERIAQSRESSQSIKKARAPKDGDVMMIDFLGTVDGTPFDGGKGENFAVKLGAGEVLEEFEKGVRGLKVNEKKTVAVTFPKDYGAPDLAGKKASFDITLKDHREPAKSKVDAELAKELGMESLDDLRRMVQDSLEHQYLRLTEQLSKRALLDALYEKFDFKIPARLVDREFEQVWAQVEQVKAKKELSPSESKLSDDELKAEYRIIAERRSRLGLLMSHTATSNNITVSEEDLDRAINEQASRYGDRMQEFTAEAKRNPNLREAIESPLLEDKVVAWMMRRVAVTNKSLDSEALIRMANEEDELQSKSDGKKKSGGKKAADKKADSKKAADKKDGAKSSAAKSGGDKSKASKAPAAKKASKKG